MGARWHRLIVPLVAVAWVVGVLPTIAAPPASAAASCWGAAARQSGSDLCPVTVSGGTTPTAKAASTDRSSVWKYVNGADCFSHSPNFPLVMCKRGYPSATAVGHVAVIGNSHAGHWMSAIEKIAIKRKWEVTTFLASGCASADLAQSFPRPETTDACQKWAQLAIQRVARGGYGLVIMSNKLYAPAVGYTVGTSVPAYQRGYTRVLKTLAATQRRVLVIRDSPSPRLDVPSCVLAHPTNYVACSGPKSTWLPADPTVAAVSALGNPRIRSVDLTKYFCSTTWCYGVIGSVIVYVDSSHLTATYGRTLAPYLEPPIMTVVSLK